MNKFFQFIKNQKDYVLFVIVILASLFSMTIENTENRKTLTETVMGTVGAIQQTGSTVAGFFSDTINSIEELRNLKEEYDLLRSELEHYQNQLVSIDELQRENLALRTLLDLSMQNQSNLTPAQIIGKTPGSFSEEFIINKGLLHGIEINAPVITLTQGERILVGRVAAVSDYQSIILPVFSNVFFVAARLSQTRHEGLISGLGEQSRLLLMNYVDREARNTINLGDKIITSGNQSLYPSGLLIGTVTAVEAQPWETSIRLNVQPSVSFNQLEYVFIMTNF